VDIPVIFHDLSNELLIRMTLLVEEEMLTILESMRT
jgi:hypothetical protein